jgi:hypothetical protein
MEETEQVYKLDVSNPVCPCCGKKLVLFDSTESIPNDGLVKESLNEQVVQTEIERVIENTANELLDLYVPDNDERDSWKVDNDVRNWVRRKSGELHFIFIEEYDIDIDIMKIEEAILEKLDEIIK